MSTQDDKTYWAEKWASMSDRPVNDFAKRTVEFLKDKGCKNLLDLGCGDGRDSVFFSENGFDVTAVDYLDGGLKILQSISPKVKCEKVDVRSLDFSDNSFDVVYAHLSLHYFDDETTRKIVKSLSQMLRDGGYLFIKCKSVEDSIYGKGEKLGEDLYMFGHQRHFFSEDYMRSVLGRDFEVLDIGSTSAEYDGKRSAFVEAVACRPAAEYASTGSA